MEKLQGTKLLEYVIEVSQTLAATRELDPLLSYAVDEVLKLVGAERGFIVLGTGDGQFEIRIKRDHTGNELSVGADELSRSIIREVLNTGEPIVARNAMNEARFAQAKSVFHLQLRSIMCAPLIAQNRTIGAIYVENRAVNGRFDEQDLIPLKLFANQAAISIENATLNEQLQVANRGLLELDGMKNNFIMLISHELQTPLTIVSAYSELLDQLAETEQEDATALQDRYRTYSKRLKDSVLRMNKTIQSIISVVQIMSGQTQAFIEEVNFSLLLKELIDNLRDVLAKRQVVLHVADLTSMPLVMADEEKIKIVLDNVLSNAIKYVPDQGQIEISAHVIENQVELQIKDTGIGIPEVEQERIFDLFHVLGSIEHHSSSQYAFRGGGMGLGLPIARGLMQAMNGSIRLESPGYDPEASPGTICYIVLPCAGA